MLTKCFWVLRRQPLLKNFFNFTPDNCICYKAAFVGHNSENVWYSVLIFRPVIYLLNYLINSNLYSQFGVKFTHNDFKGKFYAPVFPVSIRFRYKANGFVKKLKRVFYSSLSLSRGNWITHCGTKFITQSKISNIGFHYHCEYFPVINGKWR